MRARRRRDIVYFLLSAAGVVGGTAALIFSHDHSAHRHDDMPVIIRAGDLTFHNPRIVAPVAGVQTVGGFLRISNGGGGDDALIAAAADFAARAEIHETTNENGIARMRPLAELPLPAGEEVALAHGGYHLMFTGARRALTAGDSAPVVLTFARGGAVTVDFDIVAPAGAGGHAH